MTTISTDIIPLLPEGYTIQKDDNGNEVIFDNTGKQTSKSGQKKLIQKLTKQFKANQRKQAQQQKAAAQQKAAQAADVSKGNYGNRALLQSRPEDKNHNKVFTNICDLTPKNLDQVVTVRGRMANSIVKSSALIFMDIRQATFTVQAVLSKSDTISKLMLKFAEKITKESIIEIEGKVCKPAGDGVVQRVSQKDVEIIISKLFVVSKAASPLAIELADAARPQPLLDAQKLKLAKISHDIEKVEAKIEAETDEEAKAKLQQQLSDLTTAKGEALTVVDLGFKQMLDNRCLDLRTVTNQAIFRIQSGVCRLFRDFLIARDFTEIHSPKLIATASEGGADVFKLKYFDTFAYLAQSPQLYKQMAICSDLQRVFEIGPVFRAEKSITHRHMTEFVGLDLEMQFHEHYHEVLEVIGKLFVSIFEGLKKNFQTEINAVNSQFPFQPLTYPKETLVLTYKDCIELLQEAGVDIDYTDDISTKEEKMLGRLVKAKYNTDFFVADKFPLCVRPFYTMPDPNDDRWSNSYDFFLRGEEIMSGAQRVHDYELLIKMAKKHEVDLEKIKGYTDAFKYGAPPHAGGGIGMERVVMLYLALPNIRKSSLFPRTPVRLFP